MRYRTKVHKYGLILNYSPKRLGQKWLRKLFFLKGMTSKFTSIGVPDFLFLIFEN